jgi:RNA ligase
LIIPLSNFNDTSGVHNKKIEDNVTQLLSIGKYEPNSGENGGNGTPKVSTFPSHLIDKTDETRIQSHTKWIKEMQGKGYYAAVKCDGMSGSFLLDGGKDGEFLVCSRNQIRSTVVDGNTPENDAHSFIAKKYAIEEKLRTPEYENYAIQGEVCGPKIQKNLLNLPNVDFFVFNIVDIKHRQRVPLDRMIEICKELGLKHIDIVERKDEFSYKTVGELLKLSEGKYKNTKNHREGIVVRSFDGKISFKVINNQYLLKNDY